MKSIFLLCEFGIPYNTILQLYDANITIENILNNNNIMDNILGNGEKKFLILKIIDRAYLYPDDHSVYELIEFGLSKSIVESLINKKIRLKDIKQNIQEKYKIGQATYKKIEDSLQTYLETKNIKIEIDISNLFSLIYNEFQNNSFNINDLKELMSRKNYNFDSITENKLQELIDEKRIQKKGCLYNVSYTIDVLSKYGLSDKLLKYLKENKIELSDISDEEFILNFHVTPSKYTKILTSFNTFINNTNYCIELTKNRMINIIKNEFGNELFSLEQLYFLLENKKVSLEKVNDFLDNLISSNSIVKMNGLFKVVFPTLEHEIEKIDNKNNHRDIVLKKLSGLTLEQIGNDYGVTRERIRQMQNTTYEEQQKSPSFWDSLKERISKSKFISSLIIFKMELDKKIPITQILSDLKYFSKRYDFYMEKPERALEQQEILEHGYGITIYDHEQDIYGKNLEKEIEDDYEIEP